MTSNIPKICANDLLKDILEDGVDMDFPEDWKFGNYFLRFKSYCLTQCVSEGSNRPNDRKCNHCESVHTLGCGETYCKHWILSKTISDISHSGVFEECEYLDEEIIANKHNCLNNYKEQHICLTCKKKCKWIYIPPRLGAMTINIYWQNARKIIRSLPYIDDLTVGHLAKKNSQCFARRCQQLYGSYKNQQDNLAETRENVVRPSILKFIEFLRYEIDFDLNEEDQSHDEVSYCIGCRCGHKDCLGVDCACHTMVDVVVNGKTVSVNKCNGLSIVCFQCHQKFAICEFNKYITSMKNDRDVLTNTIKYQGMKCNRCFMRSCGGGRGFSLNKEISKSMEHVTKKVGRYSVKQMKSVKSKERVWKRRFSSRSISLDEFQYGIDKVREEGDEGVITEQDNIDAFNKARKLKVRPVLTYFETHKRLPNLLGKIKELKKKVNEIDTKTDVVKVWDKLKKKRKLLQGEEKERAESYVEHFIKASARKGKSVEIDMKENEFFVKIHNKFIN